MWGILNARGNAREGESGAAGGAKAGGCGADMVGVLQPGAVREGDHRGGGAEPDEQPDRGAGASGEGEAEAVGELQVGGLREDWRLRRVSFDTRR